MACVEDGCDLPILNKPRQLCSKHYQRLQKRGLPPLTARPVRHRPLEERFLAAVQWPANFFSCWLWTHHSMPKGYGAISVDGKPRLAHRVSYELAIGPIPEGLVLDHLCRVPRCVNPLHLEPVTEAENTRRGNAGRNQRAKRHCPQGHPYAGGNLYIRTDGARVCRTCLRERQRVYQANRRARALAEVGAVGA